MKPKRNPTKKRPQAGRTRALAVAPRSACSDAVLWLKTQALFDVPEAKAALREIKRLRSAIEWALGMGKDGFRPRMDGEGQYWWRTELRARALGKPNTGYEPRDCGEKSKT